MSTVYCGIGKVPKNKKVGSMGECAKKKQIRLYGVYTIDTKILSSTYKKKQKINKNDRGKLYDKLIRLKSQIKKLQEEKIKSNNKKTVEEKIFKIKKELIGIIKKIKACEKKSI